MQIAACTQQGSTHHSLTITLTITRPEVANLYLRTRTLVPIELLLFRLEVLSEPSAAISTKYRRMNPIHRHTCQRAPCGHTHTQIKESILLDRYVAYH